MHPLLVLLAAAATGAAAAHARTSRRSNPETDIEVGSQIGDYTVTSVEPYFNSSLGRVMPGIYLVRVSLPDGLWYEFFATSMQDLVSQVQKLPPAKKRPPPDPPPRSHAEVFADWVLPPDRPTAPMSPEEWYALGRSYGYW